MKNPDRSMLAIQGLGPLEAEIMRVVWKLERATVREVFEKLRPTRDKLAYTTIMTCMTNLARKGMLNQERGGIPYMYTPVETGPEIATKMVDRVIDRLLGGTAAPVISHLLNLRNPDELEEVMRLKEKLDRERSGDEPS